MNNSSLISVVIPVFNEGANLKELIRRCLASSPCSARLIG